MISAQCWRNLRYRALDDGEQQAVEECLEQIEERMKAGECWVRFSLAPGLDFAAVLRKLAGELVSNSFDVRASVASCWQSVHGGPVFTVQWKCASDVEGAIEWCADLREEMERPRLDHTLYWDGRPEPVVTEAVKEESEA